MLIGFGSRSTQIKYILHIKIYFVNVFGTTLLYQYLKVLIDLFKLWHTEYTLEIPSENSLSQLCAFLSFALHLPAPRRQMPRVHCLWPQKAHDIHSSQTGRIRFICTFSCLPSFSFSMTRGKWIYTMYVKLCYLGPLIHRKQVYIIYRIGTYNL